MEQQKHNNSDTSSAESDHNQLEKPIKDSAAANDAGRSYECTFCKRGFTNAQALGGHMNIHRKDKAKSKAKQKNQEEDPLIHSFKSKESFKNLSCFPQISLSDHDCNPVFGGHVNYQVYFASSNHSNQTRNYCPVWRPADHLKDHMNGNLSLRIGLSPPVEDEEEVDLELRLGQSIYWKNL